MNIHHLANRILTIVVWSAIALCAGRLTAATPADLNFNSASGQGISSRLIGDWQFRLLEISGDDDNGGGDFVDIIDDSYTNVTALATGSDNALLMEGTLGTAVVAQIRSRLEDPFSLVSFHIDGADTTYLITGYVAGLPVPGATQSVYSASFVDTTVTIVNTNFQNIEEFRIAREDGVADIVFFIDDINVSPAVSTSANPVIGSLSGDGVYYMEGNPPVRLDAATPATITDTDSADFHGGAIVVGITSGRIPPQDVLSITNQGTGTGQVGVSGTNVTYEGIVVGTLSGGSSYDNLLIALNGNASKPAARGIVRALTYQNISTEVPITGARGITIRVYDGDGGYGVATVSVTVEVNNNPPTVTAAYATNVFNEGINEPSLPIVVDNTLTVDDEESTTLAAATVTIIRNHVIAEDLLRFTNSPSTMGNISASFSTNTGVLTLTSAGATATLAQWTAALRSVEYDNVSDTPTVTTRSIRFAVNDGSDTGAGATNFMRVVAFNDAPVNTIPTNTLTIGTNGSGNGSIVFSITNGNAISVADLDAQTNSIQVSLTSSTGTVSLASITGLNFLVGTGTNDEIVGFTGSVSDINAALNGATYTAPDEFDGAASIIVFTSDLGNSGIGGHLVDSDTIQLLADNTAPAVPVFTGISDDTGTPGDLITADRTLIFHGTAEANSVVWISWIGVGTLGRTNVDGSGNWSFDSRDTLVTVGTNIFVAYVEDAAGNVSPVATIDVEILDNILPTVNAITRVGSSPTSATNVTFLVAFSEPVNNADASDFTLVTTGTAAGAILGFTPVGSLSQSFEVTIASVSGNGTLRLDLNDAGTGITDLGGQAIIDGFTAGETFVIDYVAPAAPAITGISEDSGTPGDFVTVDATLVVSGTAESSSIVTLTRVGTGVIGSTNADVSGNWSFDSTGIELPEGTNVFTAITTDIAGNVSAASSAFTVIVDRSFSLRFLTTATLFVPKKPAVKLDASALFDAGARLHLGGGQLAVSIPTNGTLGDVLSVYTATNSEQGISLAGTNVYWGDLLIADLVRGHPVNKPLTFTFTTNATPSAVQALVREISFLTTNASTLPRTLRLVVSDGFVATTAPAFKTVVISKALPVATVPNLFTNSVGTFSGLVLRTNDVVVSEAGAFQVKITKGLKYSGYVLIAAKKTSFSGQFNANGETSIITSGNKFGIDLQLSTDASAIRGRATAYTAGGWSSDLVGHLTAIGTPTNSAVATGAYTLLLPPSNDPQLGSGWATLTVNRVGQAKLKGTLADGQAWSSSSAIGTNGHWPLYASLDKKLGAIIGWLSFSTTTPAVIGGALTWIKPATAPLFTNGIAAELDVAGSRYIAPAGTNTFLSWTNGLLSIANGNLTAPLTNSVIITTLGKFTGSTGSISNLTLTVSAKAGSFSGGFRHPATGKTTKYSGVVLQSENLGGGFFLGTNRGGVLQLDEAP